MRRGGIKHIKSVIATSIIYAPENKFLSENEKGNNSYNTEGRDF